jgi:hypothetical protein
MRELAALRIVCANPEGNKEYLPLTGRPYRYPFAVSKDGSAPLGQHKY